MPQPLQYLPIYLAEVTETEQGDSKRSIKAKNEWTSDDVIIAPALDGLMKLPPPAVGEKVLILQLDSTNLHKFYLPIRSELSALSDSQTKVQIESDGFVELDGSEIKLGASASEEAVLGTQLKNWLTDLVTQISAITVTGNLGVASSPPVNVAAISALANSLTNILSSLVKVE